MMTRFLRTTAMVTALVLIALLLPAGALAKTVAEWLEGYDTGEIWFGEDFHYDINNEEACWELLMKPIIVLDAGQKDMIAPRTGPGEDYPKVNEDKLGGTINGASAAVHVLGEDENGWTKIEGLDYYNRIIRGYVRTNLLKEVTPNKDYGIIVDKLTQELYVYKDGKLWSSCAVSTGLPNDEQPYNETAAGEYLMVSRVGDFDSEGMICAMALRFNGGDMIHQVPYVFLGDGSKRYSTWEAKLGTRASHGCIRTARIANEDGLNMRWLWENIKVGTKVLVWDDYGRRQPYPEDSLELYYNPNGGKSYHADERCRSVKDRYLPLTGFLYGELETGDFAGLYRCKTCMPVLRKSEIDAMNLARGVEPLTEDSVAAPTGGEDAPPSSLDTSMVHESEEGEVIIVITPAEDE
ncbi:MAG: L,D-transpeptidase family protein [Clostridia bacterium]|nr:L,D-transpeptidase family protein [Clostridia bacterium]